MNRALEGSILKLNIQRAFFLTVLSKIVVDSEIDEPSTVLKHRKVNNLTGGKKP